MIECPYEDFALLLWDLECEIEGAKNGVTPPNFNEAKE